MSQENELQGLGGWLILVGIGVVIRPLILLATTVPVFLPIFLDGTWSALTTPGSELYHPYYFPLLLGEMIFNSIMLLALFYLIYLYFSKHYLFPRFFIAIMLASLIIVPIDSWFFTLIDPSEPVFDSDTTREFVRLLVSSVIWIPYMLVSKRVHATFVAHRPQS